MARATDWDRYYASPYRAASLTRRYTSSTLLHLLKSCAPVAPSILELGGANSCFANRILTEVRPCRYDVIDSNELGLTLFRSRHAGDERISATLADVLNLPPANLQYDVVYSVGLIEHFDEAGTANAIAAHFRYLRPGGLAIVTFPTPTLLYRSARAGAELTGSWIFHDERPLSLAEFVKTASRYGAIESSHILWPLILTQYCVVTRKFR